MKHYFLINPAAGKSEGKDSLCEAIRTACEERNVEYEIYYTKVGKDATRFVAQTCAENRGKALRFYACGGDGTFGEVVSGAIGYDNVEVGVLPSGTGNDFVRNFTDSHLFLDPVAQLEGEAMAADVLQCNEYYAINMINIGFDCEVVRKTATLKKNPLIPRKLAYIAGLVVTLIRKPGVRVRISVDGEEAQEKRFLLTTFANGCFCGGGFHSNPRASLSDGMVDTLLINNIGRIRFLTLVGQYKKGTHLVEKNAKILVHHKLKTIDMEFNGLQGVSIDGELAEMEKLRISCLSNAVRVVVPRGCMLRKQAAAEMAKA